MSDSNSWDECRRDFHGGSELYRENWKSLAYVKISVPNYYLPATSKERVKTGYGVEERTKEQAPLGTRMQLVGAWYGHRRIGFWNAWATDCEGKSHD